MKTINSFISEKLKITKNMLNNQHEYVDLGLPSGTLWATCNVGAKTETECGDYFSWGETKSKMEYTWVTYKFGKVNNLTKYNDEDKLTKLEPEDDAAHINMGGEWCIPTEEQFKELKKHTKHKWFENYNDTGKSGVLFTGSNGNTIFFPANGFMMNKKVFDKGTFGYYYTSNISNEISKSVTFNMDGYNIGYSSSEVRFYGQNIRGVLKK
jgi:hypothetical protein